MKKNPLARLQGLGQAVWLDSIRRGLFGSGELLRLLKEESIRGIAAAGVSFEQRAEERREPLALEDVRRAADMLRSLYYRLHAADGYVCVDLPHEVTGDTRAAMAEGRRLFRAINRPNVMLTVPATREGLLVSRQLLAEGINVNISLLFGPERYREAAEAYLYGLEEALLSNGKSLASLASVASFFVSPIDARVDPLLEDLMEGSAPAAGAAALLRGRVAIASAQAAYEVYREVFESERFRRLANRGARSQRLVWCATMPRDPAVGELKYVEALIAPDSIVALPLKTIGAYREQGDPSPRLAENLEQGRELLASVAELGIDLEEVIRGLEKAGLEHLGRRPQGLEESASARA